MLRPLHTTKLRQGYVFTGVCDSIGGGRGHAWQGVYVAGGIRWGEGACVAGGHAWQGVCMSRGQAWQGGHAWQGACMAGGVYGGGVACMAGGHAWQEKRSLQRVVRILLECILFY